jgi:cytidylate kinase
MIITIDGPAGSGKSTAARALARRLGFDFLDTGATYRAVTLACLRNRVDLADHRTLSSLLGTLQIEMDGERILLNGEDISGAIRTGEVTRAIGPVADSTVVREHLVRLQRQLAQGRDIVTEGRDQGTVVFPNAECKFFLHADAKERARRRQEEMQAKGEKVTMEQTLEDMEKRDARDAARDIAPMKPAGDAIVLDSTAMSLEEVVDRMAAECQQRSREGGSNN